MKTAYIIVTRDYDSEPIKIFLKESGAKDFVKAGGKYGYSDFSGDLYYIVEVELIE